MFCKEDVLKSFANFTGKHLYQNLLFNKKTLAQVFSCDFCKISKNTFSYRTSPVTASLIRKIRLISKSFTSQSGWQTIAMYIFTNISRSKGSRKWNQYNMRNIFLEKVFVLQKLFPDPFLEKENWAYLWINVLKFYIFCFYCWGL